MDGETELDEAQTRQDGSDERFVVVYVIQFSGKWVVRETFGVLTILLSG